MTGRLEDFRVRTCLTCRHLVIGEQGRMVEGMPETDYQTFSCAFLEESTKEYFAAPLPKREFEKVRTECPFWRERDVPEGGTTENDA